MVNKRVLYITDYCLTPYEEISNSAILCEDGIILGVGGTSAFVREPQLEVVELKNCYAVPGFIDSHIHGAGGFDSSTAHKMNEDFSGMCRTLASHGVTSFVPTIISAPEQDMLGAVKVLSGFMDEEHHGAEPVGIHVEGPFVSGSKRGSQRLEDIRPIDLGFAREIIQEGRGRIKLFTFAPELEGSIGLIELLLENSIIPSMGHSEAGEEAVLKAVAAGCTRCTHVLNGMPPLHQRDITLTSIAMTDDRITIEIILDGAHLNPRMVDLACRSKPKDKVIGVSDAIEAAGMKDGKYHIGTEEIKVKNGMSTTKDGVLAGTTLTLEEGWHHLVTYSHMDKTDAAACFTINPARDLALEKQGRLRPGHIADISFFEIGTNKTRLTVSKGRIVYDSNGQYK